MRRRRASTWTSRAAIAGALGGAAVAAAARIPAGADGVLSGALAVLGPIVAGYAVGVIAAHRRREAEDIAYILRLREELRASQDHIMESATFRSLGTYLEIAAHQLREPLNRLAAGVQGLAADVALPEPLQRAVAGLSTQLEAVQGVLRHLSSYALTRPARAPFDVNDLLREAILLVRHRAEEKAIVFEERYAVVPPVFGPASRVQQAVLNVIVNAVEAMPFGGGTIRVETAHEGDRVTARVRDGGIGVRPEHLPRVLDPFFTTKPERSGVGLGLWATKQALDLIGADIALTSVPLQGTEVVMSFPQAAPVRAGREGADHPPELPLNTADERGRQIA
jgi:signal transduction histidine kinase